MVDARESFFHEMMCPGTIRLDVMFIDPWLAVDFVSTQVENQESVFEHRIARRLKDVDKCAPIQKSKETVCSICLEELPENTRVTLCNHSFCSHCIEKWFDLNTTCPICKHDFGEECGYTLIDTQNMTEVDATTQRETDSDREVMDSISNRLQTMYSILNSYQ